MLLCFVMLIAYCCVRCLRHRVLFCLWSRLERAVADFNTTRPSDIFVVNFGAHYPDTPEDEEVFRRDIAAVLESMAQLGETATAIWRYFCS